MSLRAGYNRFVWRCERTEIGFGCAFANAMPQWEPCNYVLPYKEYDGEAGILYTEPVDERMQIDVGSFFGDFMPPELTWLPRAEKKSLVGAGVYAAWLKGSVRVPLAAHDAVTLIVDGKPGRVIPGAQHDVVAVGPYQAVAALVSDSDWAWRKPPVHIHGRTTPYLIMGPLKTADTSAFTACAMGQLVEGAEGTITWRTGFDGVALRPYVESKLFGRWTYPLGVTLYGMWQAGRFPEPRGHERLCDKPCGSGRLHP